MRFMKQSFWGLVGLAATAMAYNPISTYHYLADPGAAADDDYFYIITDSDDPAPYDADGDAHGGYVIKALYGFRSKDMQNWTDFGIIYDARQIEGIGDIWASGLAVRDGKFYIVFPDGGGSGIGYIKADDIAGPWSNAVGGGKNKLVAGGGNGLTDCDGVAWCFDPGIFIDDDGSTYVTWGGGENSSRPNTDNFDVVKLNDARDGISGTAQHVKVEGLEKDPNKRAMLEASYIHRYGDNYYFSYSTGWQKGAPTIDYAMSKNVKGPYTWKGTILEDPNINGVSINGNNNHHAIAHFKGHAYAVYHDRRIAKGYDGLEIITADDGVQNPSEGYHRSVSVDEMFYNTDGTIKSVTFTKEGPKQIVGFDPYQKYPALTSSRQKGVRSRSLWTPGKVASSVLLPLSSKESWIRVSGVNFKKGGASKFTVKAASVAEGNMVEVRTGSATGALAGTCNLKKTSSKETYADTECDMDGTVLKDSVPQVFLVFKGSADSTMAISQWYFTPKNSSDISSSASTVSSSSSAAKPRQPYDGKVANVPGKIEVEYFDVPGEGEANQTYYDKSEGNAACQDGSDSECSKVREGTDVDLKKAASGVAIGWFQTDEWLEYTVYAEKEGTYTLYVAAASQGGGSLQFTVRDASGKEISKTDDIEVSAASSEEAAFSEYAKTAGVNVTLAKGVNVIRMTCTKEYLDVDYFNLVYGENAEDNALIGQDVEPEYTPAEEILSSASGEVKSSDSKDAIAVRYMVGSMSKTYNVYDMQGVMLGKVQVDGVSASEALNRAGFRAGRYILCNKYNRMVVNSVNRK